MVKWSDKNTQDKAGIILKRIKTGFTLMVMLIVIAIIAVLIAIAIPIFSSQLEKTREATDLTNVRSAYAQVSTEALLGNSEITVTVDLTQKQADWQSLDPVDIGGIVHYKKQGDTDNWKGVAAPNGTCVVSYNEDYGIILTWSGKADPTTPAYPFNTSVTDFFSLLYDTAFWKNGSMLIGWLFRNGYVKIILDTNLTNSRAQHVYELLGFRKVRTNIDSWKDQLGQLQSSVDYELVEKDFVSYE